MRTSAVLEHLPALYQQPAEVLKALKSCPSDIVELRMSLDQGSTFEIRRKTPLTTERAEPADVLARTVYAVRTLGLFELSLICPGESVAASEYNARFAR